ncbi:MAG: hypothetical protein Kow00121_29090 [Elainellaceae cyanobacterium]
MPRSRAWQSRTALFLAMGLVSTVAIPLSMANPVNAAPDPLLVGQRFPESWRSSLPAGTQIPVEYEDDEADKIVLTPDETVPVTLRVTDDITSSSGRVIIPRGSLIEGELVPSGGGTRFVAETLIIDDDQTEDIDATSNVVTETEIIDEKDNPDILRGAAVGGAAAAVLSEIFGRIDAWEVLAGAGLGVLTEIFVLRRDREVEVLVVRPEELDLRLRSEFVRN